MAGGIMKEKINVMLQKKRIPNLPSRVFKTSYNYDSWNRLQYMIYPDQEKVNYSYDLGGNLTRMTGQVYNEPYNYIDRIDYDYYEQRAYLKYGNKTETFYNYTPALRRLVNLNVKTADTQDLFNNFYKYDKVGNVTSLINQAGANANTMGGNYGYDFEYDNLNRLAGAKGYFRGNQEQQQNNNDFQSDYTIKMEYNPTHGIENKTQIHYKNLDATPVAANSYSNTYKYEDNTHKVVHIDDSMTGATEDFKYDLNGNLIYKTNTDGSSRSLYWDESNRLRVVNEHKGMQHYIYDASGERILKANTNTEAVYGNGSLLDPASTTINSYTTYPSANLVIDANGIYSKHYYAGTQRIVSRIGEKSIRIFDVELPCENCMKLQELQKTNLQQILANGKLGQATFKPYQPSTYDEAQKALAEEDKENLNEALAPPSGAGGIYFYHPDHLGTSTFLTDYNGNAYQFFLNLPFGETMAEQLGSNYYNTPYKFNGKELDEETGLYYYGARYFDPRTSIWLSVDPMAEKGPGYSPYNYCFNNPVHFTDSDGRWPDPPFGFRLGFNLGLGSNGLNFNVTASVGVELRTPNFQAVAFASASVYGGQQLGTSSMTRGLQFDVTAGAYASVGNGKGSAHNFYTLNSNTPSPFNNTFDTSVSYGQMLTYNSAINAQGDGPGIQSEGLIGMRFGENFSLTSNNDANTYGSNLIFNKNKGSDAGWTGGIVLNVGGVEAGYQNFSGYWAEFPNRPKGDLYSAENRAAGNGNYHQSLNRAFNFVRKGNFSGGIYSGAWFQNFIHDNISKDAKYIYNNQGKVNTTIGQ